MRIAVIADEITAAGWRLAGAVVRVPEPSETQAAFASAAADAQIVLITTEFAALVDPASLARALLAATPLVLVIDDTRGWLPRADMERDVRRALGVDA